MRIFPALTSIALGATALVAALALSTPAEACFVVGPAPLFIVPSLPNPALTPPCPPPAGAFSTFAAAVAFSNDQLALLSPRPVSPVSPVSPGSFSSPSFPSAPNSGDGFSTATDALNFGNAAPGSQPGGGDLTPIDFINAARLSGFWIERRYSDWLAGRGHSDGDADSADAAADASPSGQRPLISDVLPDNDQDADGYDDNTGEFLYSTLVEDIDKNRDGVIDDDLNPACGGGSCDVAGFLDGLGGDSCSGGSCDVGDIFSAMVNVTDSGRISGFTLIEGGCDVGDCGAGEGAGEGADGWPNVMVQVLDLDGIRNPAGRTVESMHIQGSGGDDPLDLRSDFFVNANPAVAARRRDTPQQTGVRAPAITSYESISEGLDAAVTGNGPGHANRARVILDNTDDASNDESFPWHVPNTVEVVTVEHPNSSSGGGINPGNFVVTVTNGVISNIAVTPLTIENSTVPGNTAGPMTGGNINPMTGEGTGPMTGGAINPMTGEGTGPMTGGAINPMTGEGTGGMSGGNTNVPELLFDDATWEGVKNGTLKLTTALEVVPR